MSRNTVAKITRAVAIGVLAYASTSCIDSRVKTFECEVDGLEDIEKLSFSDEFQERFLRAVTDPSKQEEFVNDYISLAGPGAKVFDTKYEEEPVLSTERIPYAMRTYGFPFSPELERPIIRISPAAFNGPDRSETVEDFSSNYAHEINHACRMLNGDSPDVSFSMDQDGIPHINLWRHLDELAAIIYQTNKTVRFDGGRVVSKLSGHTTKDLLSEYVGHQVKIREYDFSNFEKGHRAQLLQVFQSPVMEAIVDHHLGARRPYEKAL